MAAVAPHGALLGLSLRLRVRGGHQRASGKQLTVPEATEPVNSCARVKAIVDLSQTRFDYMSVNLCSRQIGVTEHGLDRAQICPTLQQMRRKRMTQNMRAERRVNPGALSVGLQELPEAHAGQSLAVPRIDEQPGAI